MSKKPIECMTAGEINKTLDRLDRVSSDLSSEFIAVGRGHEKPSETLRKDDPLAVKYRELSDKRWAVRREVERRYGPSAPSRLPKGFGPISCAEKK